MEYRRLGKTGLMVSPLCMGTMQFGWTADEALARRILSAAWEAGVNFIDTADIYSRWVDGNPGGVSEEMIGRWIRQAGIPRDDLVIATKVRGRMGPGPNDEGLARVHILQAVEDSLRRLQTDYIDLYQFHWPDDHTPIEESLRALDDLVSQGKVRYAGCSNFAAWELVRALWTAERSNLISFACVQPHYNLVHRAEFERELRPACEAYGLGVIPYSPLAGGFLTGKYHRDHQPEGARLGAARRYFTEANWLLLDRLDAAAHRLQCSPAQLALAWLLADPLITSPIIGPNSLEQWRDNLGALSVALPPEEREELARLSEWQSRQDD